MRKTLFMGGLFILALLVVYGCVPQQPGTKVIKIGAMAPLTGDAAPYGLGIQKGIDLAVQEVNQRGELPGQIKVVYEDSMCDPAESATSIQKLINVDGVQAIVGEVCSSATLAAAPIAEANKVVLISSASTNPDISDSGDYIFRTVPSDALQGAFGAELVSDLGYSKLAILHTNEDYGIGFKDVLEENFDGEIVAIESVERDATDAKTQLTKIKAKDPDAIYVITNAPTIAGIALKQIKELGLDVQVFGSEGLKDGSVVEAASGGAEGMILTTVSGGNPVFVELHKRVYGSDPGPFAAQAYDAVKALAEALKASDGTGTGIKNALYNVEFDGASGKITFDSNGDVAGNYKLFTVEDGEFVVFEK